eukprot:2042518-Prymnesium_polylepis.1
MQEARAEADGARREHGVDCARRREVPQRGAGLEELIARGGGGAAAALAESMGCEHEPMRQRAVAWPVRVRGGSVG